MGLEAKQIREVGQSDAGEGEKRPGLSERAWTLLWTHARDSTGCRLDIDHRTGACPRLDWRLLRWHWRPAS